ncbi:MAG: DUF4153 domain-containing protein [Gemmatimonadota bacterium]|nr:MAG: DUF4153 domain-containing protein [Gemmatimonadota bacterium]
MESSDEIRKHRFSPLIALLVRARETFERFPLPLLSAIGAALIAHRLAEIEFDVESGALALYPAWMACILGISFFLALRLLSESRNWSRTIRLAVGLSGLVLVVAYYLILPVPVKGADVTSFMLLLAGIHLIVSFVPFLGRSGEENAFWQFNRSLLLRFVLAAFYTGVLYIGLALAVTACKNLLDIDFDEAIYGQLWFWLAFVYSTWFFLAGVPRDASKLQEVREYPIGLKIFTQYVLIPLVAVYLVILYAYMGKIIVEWNLPQGWVGYPVIGVSVAGLLALLLVHPIRQQAENSWIVTYSKFFYWILFPLIGLIFIAIWTRISDYGLTERRYLVVWASIWLLGIAIYYTIRRSGDIRAIPVSLCVITLLGSFGPWSATSFARRSQLSRLREMLISEEVMADGVLDRTRKRLAFDQRREISDVVHYVVTFHGIDRIRGWYAEPERLPDDATPQLALEEMGLEYIGRWQQRPEGFLVDGSLPNPISVEGFDYLYRLDASFDPDSARVQAVLDSLTTMSLVGTVMRISGPDPTQSLSIDLAPTLAELSNKQEQGADYGAEETRLEAENPAFRMVVYLDSVGGGGERDSLRLNQISAVVLITRKD